MTIRQPMKQHERQIGSRLTQLDPVKTAALDFGEAMTRVKLGLAFVMPTGPRARSLFPPERSGSALA
jgi:hypothetical protein